MPRSDPEPAARPLLVGPLMPPLVPPTFEEMMLRLTTLTSPGSVVFGWFFANLSMSTSRSAASWSNTCRLFCALTRGSTGVVGLGTAGAFSAGFSGLGGGGGGGGGGGSMTNCTTLSGRDSVFTTILCRGRKGMMTAMMANTMARLRRMARKRRSMVAVGGHGAALPRHSAQSRRRVRHHRGHHSLSAAAQDRREHGISARESGAIGHGAAAPSTPSAAAQA